MSVAGTLRPEPAARWARAALWPLLWREWQHHPWRHGVALLAVALGVALAWSVHLINRSALHEFGQAVRSANGEPDLVLRGQAGSFDEGWFLRLANDAAVARASAVVEVDTYARPDPAAAGPPAPVAGSSSGSSGSSAAMEAMAVRTPLRVLGVDLLRAAALAPDLLPHSPRAGQPLELRDLLDPRTVHLNRAALDRLGRAAGDAAGGRLQLQSGSTWHTLRVVGVVAVPGPPLAVMDIAGAQEVFDLIGRISRIDLRLQPGQDASLLLQRLALPPGVRAGSAAEAGERLSNLSRAYRVNLTVLALVALLVGAFLVYSVVSLSVAQRGPMLALLGVLGLTAQGRRALVLAECAALGAAGAALGVGLGTGLAAAALQGLAGDLGGGYFPGVTPALAWSTPAAFAFFALGVASAMAGGWWPARQAERLVPALALKGLAAPGVGRAATGPALALLAAGTLLALAPPVGGLPLAAYAAVAALLVGGVALVPAVVHALLPAASQARPRHAPPGLLTHLAWRRAGLQRATATAATAGVVASLALSVALTVMVASFRHGVTQWLDEVLPADLYARSAATSALAETAWLPPELPAQAAQLPGVQRVTASRVRALSLAPGRPAVALLARPLAESAPGTPALPLVVPALPASGTQPAVFVSEATAALYGVRPGQRLTLPLPGPDSRADGPERGPSEATLPAQGLEVLVRGVYRDYARQAGSITMDHARYVELTGDRRLNDLALWLQPGADLSAVQAALRALLPDPAGLDFAASRELRQISLAIFDRSFAVTYYLQAVAIAIGLVGVAASLSAQVLARRREFGLLTHLGFTRPQLLALVTGETAAWMAAGVVVGLALGVALSVVLVHVVNPQSFHWTMQLVLPAGRLALLAAAVFLAGTATAALSARGATRRAAVQSVKEDW